ncbi:nucleoside monophosphate kinase [Actomonas aquatica]|uniref:Nucleoside monophosphate kinase n=1 Tax=Actomonas aquatica TaxID=2866162 RepID=A0ABZ1CD91_9BACT|nr:nucleoside monophosphate kinase [Opitutus sp. WL0086]WRQ89653.1 nucleoside monophosphate kinase [Opitutus sp. WL0086]
MPAKAKVLILGSISSALAERSRSLNFEHVSSVEMIRQEISRRTPAGQAAERALEKGLPIPDQVIFGVMRRWFWARKPDAGFVLTDFPATLLQAKVFDEWFESRGMSLSACAVGDAADSVVVDHYRTQGYDVFVADQLLAV